MMTRWVNRISSSALPREYFSRATPGFQVLTGVAPDAEHVEKVPADTGFRLLLSGRARGRPDAKDPGAPSSARSRLPGGFHDLQQAFSRVLRAGHGLDGLVEILGTQPECRDVLRQSQLGDQGEHSGRRSLRRRGNR